MVVKMDKTDKKKDLSKKSAKKFKTKPTKSTKPSDKPEQPISKKDKKMKQLKKGKTEEGKDSITAAKMEKNKTLLKKKKERKEGREDSAKKTTKKDKPSTGDKMAERKPKSALKKPTGGKKKDGKDDRPKLEEMSTKERKLVRKKAKSNYDLSLRAKQIWEKVRDHNCKPETRTSLLEELYGLIKGRAKELVLAHDTVRVIQCCVKFSNAAQKQGIFDEVKGSILELCKSKYGKFYVLKVLKYGTKEQRDFVIESFYGNVCKLVQHSIAAEVVETAYNNWANAQHRSALLEEFYGAKYAVFKEAGVHTLADILEKHPENKQSILEHMLKVITPLLEKTVIKHTIVHKVLLDYLMYAPLKMQGELIQLMREVVVQILHTHDGARAAMYCFWFGTAKDRKIMIKSFKTFVARICKEEFGHRALMTMFDTVDDTKLVGKVIIDEMMKTTSEIAHDSYGRKVLLYLLTPRNATHFHPDVVKQLQKGDGNANSKKDIAVRRKELLDVASPGLLQLVIDETKALIMDKSSSQLALAILEHTQGDKKEAYQAIASLAAEEFEPAVMDSEENMAQMHITEHPSGHFFLRCLLKQEKALLDQSQEPTEPPTVLFSEVLLETVSDENLRSWIGTNRSTFVLVNLVESRNESVKLRLQTALKSSMRTMKSNPTKATALLMTKL